MARFTTAGTFTVQITNALLADPKFSKDPNAFDVCLEVKHLESGAEDVWRGEFSNSYGMGKVAHLKQRQLTVQSLEKIGWQSGEDFSQLPTLIGMEVQVGVVASESNGTTYYNVRYLGGGSAEKPAQINDYAQRMAALNGQGGGFGQPQAAPAPQGGFGQPAPQAAPPVPQGGFGQPQAAPAPQQAPAQMPMPGMPQQ